MNTRTEKIEHLFRIALAVYFVLLVLAMYPYTNDPTGDIKRLISHWSALLLGLSWLISLWAYKIPFRRPRLFFEVLICFILLYTIAGLRSSYRGASLVQCSIFLSHFTLYLVASQVYRDPVHLKRFFGAVCCAVALAACYGFCQGMGLDLFPWADRSSDVYTNLPATFGNPNFAAHTLILTIILGLYLALRTKRRYFFLFLVALCLIHLRFTDQRAGLIGLAAAAALVLLAVFLGRLRKHKPASGKFALRAVVAVIVLFALLGACGAGAIMGWSKWRSGNAIPLDTSLLLRYQSYVSASDMVLDSPLLGHGPGVYALEYPTFWTQFEKEWFAQTHRMNAHVHNDLMELAIDAGLPAAGLYLALIALAICFALLMAYTAQDKDRRYLGLTLAAFFCAFGIDGLFGFNLRVPVSAALFFLMLGALEGYWREAPKAEEENSTSLLKGRVAALLLTAMLLFSTLQGSREFIGEYLLQRGMVQEHREKLSEAAATFERGEKWAPWNPAFARRLGQLAMQNKDMEQAIVDFKRSLSLNPGHIMVNLPLAHAQMYLAQQQMRDHPEEAEVALALLDEAFQDTQAALTICPMLPRAEDLLGRIASISAVFLGKMGTPKEDARVQEYWRQSETHLLQAIRYGASNQSDLYQMVSKIRIALGNIEGAEEALVRAAQADPRNGKLWPIFLSFAQAYDRYDRIVNTLYARIDLLKEMQTPEAKYLSNTYLWLAKAYENQNKESELTESAYKQALEYGPNRPEVWTNYAQYAFSKKRLPALKAAIRETCARLEAEEIRPLAHVAAVNAVLENPSLLDNASTILLSRYRDPAKESLLKPNQIYGWAAQLLLESLQAAPAETKVCEAYLNLAILFAGLDDLNQAHFLFEKADACLQEDRKAFLAIHWADTLIRLDRPDQALQRLRLARDTHPENLDVTWALARTLGKMNLLTEARSVYGALLEEEELDPKGRQMLQAELNKLETQ